MFVIYQTTHVSFAPAKSIIDVPVMDFLFQLIFVFPLFEIH